MFPFKGFKDCSTLVWEGGVSFLQEHIQSTTCIWEAKLLTKRSLTKVWEVVSFSKLLWPLPFIFYFVSNPAWEGNFTTYLYGYGAPDQGRGIHFHFLERATLFWTHRSSSNYQQPFQIIHREFAQKKTLRTQSNRCSLCCVRYAIVRSLWWGYREI